MQKLRNSLAVLVFAILASLGTAAAQDASFETGSIDAVIDGSHYRAYTYATPVAENVADGVTDEAQRAILEKVAGTTQHSATFMHMAAMEMGGIVLLPETIFVTLSTRTDNPDGDSVGSFNITFSLDPASIEPGAEQDVEVVFYPEGLNFSEYYALTEGSFELLALEVVDASTLAMSGTISGLLSWQDGFEVAHNPADVLPIEATFSIDQVVSSDAALELITDE